MSLKSEYPADIEVSHWTDITLCATKIKMITKTAIKFRPLIAFSTKRLDD
jgi:hypothetical protein